MDQVIVSKNGMSSVMRLNDTYGLEKDEERWDQIIGEKVMYEMDSIHADAQIRAWRDKKSVSVHPDNNTVLTQ